jgi:hypothetical protein
LLQTKILPEKKPDARAAYYGNPLSNASETENTAGMFLLERITSASLRYFIGPYPLIGIQHLGLNQEFILLRKLLFQREIKPINIYGSLAFADTKHKLGGPTMRIVLSILYNSPIPKLAGC